MTDTLPRLPTEPAVWYPRLTAPTAVAGPVALDRRARLGALGGPRRAIPPQMTTAEILVGVRPVHDPRS